MYWITRLGAGYVGLVSIDRRQVLIDQAVQANAVCDVVDSVGSNIILYTLDDEDALPYRVREALDKADEEELLPVIDDLAFEQYINPLRPRRKSAYATIFGYATRTWSAVIYNPYGEDVETQLRGTDEDELYPIAWN